MRRRFNQDLLPKGPPPRGEELPRSKPIGSSFNQWFRRNLEENGITVAYFCRVSGQPYPTVRGWLARCNPHIWGQCRIAEAFERMGLGDYEDLRETIRALCAKK